uniref:WemS n=1 Tax=Proteus mirabilis TaxID=584 RepID=D9YZ36_PROMI|nr:WemS [Proteus mirabilis]
MIQENKNAYPLVSIIISTYNRKNLLKRAITSAIKQDYPNIEIIISDDNSLDDNEEMIENIKKQTTIPIFYMKNKKNMGACFTRNQGIKIASGKYIAGLDDDDEFTPNRISLLVKIYNISKTLSADFDYCRVDFYITPDDSIYFGELIFTPCNGMDDFYPNEWDYLLGKEWIIDDSRK